MKMRLFLILALSFLVLTPSALAETIRPIEVKREANQTRITAVRRERIRSFFGKMVVRIEATIERLEKITDRVEFKKGDVKETRLNLDKAKIELTTLKTNFETMLVADKPKLAFEYVRESLKKINQYLKDAHKNLVQTIGEIRGLGVGEDKK